MPTVTLTGQSATASAGNLRISSSDWYSFYFEQELGIDGFGTGLISVSGIESESAYESANGLGGAQAETTGTESVSSFGSVIISGTENVSVLIDGIGLSTNAGSLEASGESPIVWSSGKPMRYSANAFKNAKIALNSVDAYSNVAEITASGTIHIHASAQIINVVSLTEVNTVYASGTVGISDDELIMLLAA